jgi:ribonuclease D
MNPAIANKKSWKRMTKEEINEFPIRRYDGPVHIIKTEDELLKAVEILKDETILGFDTETRPAFRKGEHYSPALLQLAGANDAFLFQLKQTGLPKSLKDILGNPNIIKAGVSIDYDISELRELSDFEPMGFVELGNRAKELGIQNLGLRGLAAVVLGFRISKGASTSNWENSNLTHSQIAYAATDAWVGRELYMAICS